MGFDISRFRETKKKTTRYSRQLERLRAQGRYINGIEMAVEGAIRNIDSRESRSFVIYGEPQSGKTEMMIALTARLLDEGHKIVIILLNDSLQLLNQNLDRFRRSTIDPAPKNYSEIIDSSIHIGENEWIIFSKKNSRDLQKLISKIGRHKGKVILDDEADYATPNSKINKGELSRINKLVGDLLGDDGLYIGVTATPARLDLNNTFENDNERWVDFLPHPEYTGQKTFFPTEQGESETLNFSLSLLPEVGDNPKHLRDALLSFLINVAYLNLEVNAVEKNYCMLVHTSGKKVDHSEDYKQIIKVINALNDHGDAKFEGYVRQIWEKAQSRYSGVEDRIVEYILDNISRSDVVTLNSDRVVEDTTRATQPSTPFTVTIGGNIVSRGVTFENLLSMFFTRDAKHKIQQDTYIQRARMFGSRHTYLKYFELSIPENLYLDWQKCFVFHQLSLGAIRAGKGSPVWLADHRVKPVANSSINLTTVDIDRGFMSFEMFDYSPKIDEIVDNDSLTPVIKLEKLTKYIGDDHIHPYLLDFIKAFSPNGDESLAVHKTRLVSKEAEYHNTLIRGEAGGIFGGSDVNKYPKAAHHIMVLRNTENKARVIYRYVGNITTIKKRARKLFID